MTPERWEQVGKLYQAALALQPDEREAFLSSSCADDQDLRREVESLLAAEDRAGSFLAGGAMNDAAKMIIEDEQKSLSLVGKELGHCRVLSLLGAGGMGEVYLAEDTRLKRRVALKLLPAELTANRDRVRRFEQEARAASALNHPNIITVHEIGESDGAHYLVTEFVDGETLRQRLTRDRMELSDALEVILQVASALATAHEAGIVHRDIKPENIMVRRDGLVKVLDFGVAKLAEAPALTQGAEEPTAVKLSTETGVVMGTVRYMSPEQARGLKVDVRTDIFSLGVVLYEMIAGRPPFEGETQSDLMAAILKTEPTPMADDTREVPRDLEHIVNRALRKNPEERYQVVKDLLLDLKDFKREIESSAGITRLHRGVQQQDQNGALVAATKPARLRSLLWLIAGALILVTGTFGITLWLTRSPSLKPVRKVALVKMTSDSGLTTDPALSPDGRLLTYASDRSGEGNLDIWVQQVAGGEPIRLTRDPADEHEPSFSPDGSKIVFRSEAEGGGIYMISALGGQPRRVAALGRRPQFSPDGSWITYWVGHPDSFGLGKIYLIASTGGTPTQLAPNFGGALSPIWSPDGRLLLFRGWQQTGEGRNVDWWVTPLDGGPPIRTGALDLLRAKGFDTGIYPYAIPQAWTRDGRYIVFSAKLGDTSNVWRIAIDPKTWQVSGESERLTSGTTLDVHPSFDAGDHLAFASISQSDDIWSLPIDPNQGKPRGEIQRLTTDGNVMMPAISLDGKRLVFVSNRSGNRDIWLRELAKSQEVALSVTPVNEGFPQITADGSKVAYVAVDNQKSYIYMMPIGPEGQPGVPQKICDDCGGAPISWSSDQESLLYFPYYSPRPTNQLSLLSIRSSQKTTLVEHRENTLWEGQFCCVDQWVVFLAHSPSGSSRVYVVPNRPGPISESEWIPITDGKSWEDKPRWSPDGNLIYFTSDRDGFRCIWAQRVDATKHPLGPPFPVYHSHKARQSLTNVGLFPLDISVARDRIVFNMGERIGNIWMMSLEGEP